MKKKLRRKKKKEITLIGFCKLCEFSLTASRQNTNPLWYNDNDGAEHQIALPPSIMFFKALERTDTDRGRDHGL
jgi:hypothetical protein